MTNKTQELNNPISEIKISPFLKNMVESASPGQLVVILYDGAIQWLQMAKQEINKYENKVPDWSNYAYQMRMAQGIIDYLQDSLDTELMPDFAEKLFSLYEFYKTEISKANVSKDKEQIDSCIKFFQGMRQTWSQAVKSEAKNTNNSTKAY